MNNDVVLDNVVGLHRLGRDSPGNQAASEASSDAAPIIGVSGRARQREAGDGGSSNQNRLHFNRLLSWRRDRPA
jgi:hypothetical protein